MSDTLIRILNERNLSALFQPILDLPKGDIMGFEGLIRGPSDSPLHAPANLFAAADQAQLGLEIEMLSRQVVMEQFATLGLPGKLFLNVSPRALLHPSFRTGQTLVHLQRLGISPAQVVIEITENQPTFDYEEVRNALLHYRSMGFQIAIDDLGAGFSSLRLWSELHPEYVKIDMHFVQGINTDPVKQQFLRSMHQIAERAGTQLVVEGIENSDEFRVVSEMGVALGQGYFISRPVPVPPLTPAVEATSELNRIRATRSARLNYTPQRQVTAEKLLSYVEPVHPDTPHETLFARFSANPRLQSIPVVQHGRPVALIERQNFLVCFAQPYRRELLGKKPCTSCFGNGCCKEQTHACVNRAPLLVEKSLPIHELSNFLIADSNDAFTTSFIITERGHYLGTGRSQDLLREISQMQIMTARHANPLTLLPGNVPINEHIDDLLAQDESFAVCYADLDHFKPYNDVYGFRKGDEAIQLTAKVLSAVCDPQYDFIGHIGGDDFILILRSPDWERRCQRALSAFEAMRGILFSQEHQLQSGYTSADRQGNLIHHPLSSLSIGAVWVSPDYFASHHEVSEAASAAKKQAKHKSGNSLFIERRRLDMPHLAGEDILMPHAFN